MGETRARAVQGFPDGTASNTDHSRAAGSRLTQPLLGAPGYAQDGQNAAQLRGESAGALLIEADERWRLA